jgi:hypothetical protein
MVVIGLRCGRLLNTVRRIVSFDVGRITMAVASLEKTGNGVCIPDPVSTPVERFSSVLSCWKLDGIEIKNITGKNNQTMTDNLVKWLDSNPCKIHSADQVLIEYQSGRFSRKMAMLQYCINVYFKTRSIDSDVRIVTCKNNIIVESTYVARKKSAVDVVRASLSQFPEYADLREKIGKKADPCDAILQAAAWVEGWKED